MKHDEHELFNQGAADGIRVIFSEAGFVENTHYFFSNGLLFMNEEYREAMLDAIGDYMMKFPPPPEALEQNNQNLVTPNSKTAKHMNDY